MKNYSAKEIKNIVLIGAPGSGKTTLAEAMAYEGKVIDRRGAVETNNTLSDNTDIEHEYKRSIYSTILFTEFMERKLNIIDCPGSDDFCGSLFSAFKVGDVGVMVFNAQNGWEVGSEIQARYSRELSKPLIGVINQLDAEKANFEGTVESIRAASRVKPVIVQYPVNQGPGFNAFIDVLMMKLYRHARGARYSGRGDGARHGAEPRIGGDGRRERRGAHGALFRKGDAHAGRHPFGTQNRSLAA